MHPLVNYGGDMRLGMLELVRELLNLLMLLQFGGCGLGRGESGGVVCL